MLTKIMKWVSVTALLLALLWPSAAGYPMLLLGICGLCVSILAAQASRAGKHFGGGRMHDGFARGEI